jgi:hypothetical protein
MKTREFYAVLNAVNMGCDVTYRNLSISNLGSHIPTRQLFDRKYQVDFDGYFKFSQIYHKPEIAVDKFLGILKQIKEKESGNDVKPGNE